MDYNMAICNLRTGNRLECERMLIRSQNKEWFVNLDQINTISIEIHEDRAYILSYQGTVDTATRLAEYSTKDRAVKVLDMIQESFAKSITFPAVLGMIDVSNFRTETETNEFGKMIDKFGKMVMVFQMPQDEEVKI